MTFSEQCLMSETGGFELPCLQGYMGILTGNLKFSGLGEKELLLTAKYFSTSFLSPCLHGVIAVRARCCIQWVVL